MFPTTHSFGRCCAGRARKRRPKRTRGRLLYIMVSVRGFTPEPRSRSRSREGGVVTGGKPTTPEDTREQGDTNTQYNRQTTALRSPRLLASGCRRGSSCNAMWCGIALAFNSRTPPHCEGHSCLLSPDCEGHSCPSQCTTEMGRRW